MMAATQRPITQAAFAEPQLRSAWQVMPSWTIYGDGEAFPSVRVIAAELKVHPNTVMKVTQRLIADGWLNSRPGVGAFVAEPPEARAGDKGRLLDQEVEKLTVEALRVGLGLEDLIEAIRERWRKLEGDKT